MTRLLTSIFLGLTLFACQNRSDTKSDVNRDISVDTSTFAILPVDTSILDYRDFRPDTTMKFTPGDLGTIESLIRSAVDRYNNNDAQGMLDEWRNAYDTTNAKLSDFEIDLRKYKRQYSSVILPHGQKVVYANCFRETEANEFPEWRKQIIVAEGGGIYYFNVKISLADKNYFDFSINPFE